MNTPLINKENYSCFFSSNIEIETEQTIHLEIHTENSQPPREELLSRFTPIDQTPQAELTRILEKGGLIDKNGNVILKNDISFSLDELQKKHLLQILSANVNIQCLNTNTQFTLNTMLKYLIENAPSPIENVFFIGGIVRFLLRSSADFCASIFQKAEIEIPKDILENLLSSISEPLPDLDIRFKLKSIDPKNEYFALDCCRENVVTFFQHHFQQKTTSHIPVPTISQNALIKNKTIVLDKLAFSIIAFGKTNLNLIQPQPYIECLFTSRLGETTHLFSRDNLHIEIKADLLSQQNTDTLSLCSYGNGQFKAILHILLQKIEFEHDTDFNGVMRVISLVTRGNTLVNSLEELKKRLLSFISTKRNDLLKFLCEAVNRCLDNHHKLVPETHAFFLYNLASALDEDTRDRDLSKLWLQICPSSEKQLCQQNSISSLLTLLIGRKKASFELVEAVLGLAALLHLSRTSAQEKSPLTLLCIHGKQLFMKMRFGKSDPSFLLLPFSPSKFLKTLAKEISSKNELLLEKLFQEVQNLAPEFCNTHSLLDAYRAPFLRVYEALLKQVKETDQMGSKLVNTICKEIEWSFRTSTINTENFLHRLLKANSAQQRLVLFSKLSHQLADTCLGNKLKKHEKQWKILLDEPFKLKHVIGYWIYHLLKSEDKACFQIAVQLCRKHDEQHQILSLPFLPKLIPTIFSKDFSSAQSLMRMLQVKKKPCFSLEQEFEYIVAMLKKLHTMPQPFLFLAETIAATSILERFIKRYEKETHMSLNSQEICLQFIERLFYEGFYQDAKMLLTKMTALKLIPISNQTTQDLWLCAYSIETERKGSLGMPSYTFWKEGLRSAIWQNLSDQQMYLEAMVKTIDQLTLLTSHDEETTQMLKNLKLSSEQKKSHLASSIETYAQKIFAKKLQSKQTEKSLEEIYETLKTLKHHLGKKAKCQILFSLFEAHLPLKLWDQAFKLWNSLMQAEQHSEKMNEITQSFCENLLKTNRFSILLKILQKPLIKEMLIYLDRVWIAYPLLTFKFLKLHELQIPSERTLSIAKSAFEGVFKLKIQEKFLFFTKQAYDRLLNGELISVRIGEVIEQMICTEKSAKVLEQCLKLLDRYHPPELIVWTTVFTALENFPDHSLAWQTFQKGSIRPQESENSADLFRCWLGVLSCLKYNMSPTLVSILNDFFVPESVIRRLISDTSHPSLHLNLLIVLAESTALLENKKMIDSKKTAQICLEIIKMTEKFQKEELLDLSLKSILESTLGYLLLQEEIDIFCKSSRIAYELFEKTPHLISEKILFHLLRQGAKWENHEEFFKNHVFEIVLNISKHLVKDKSLPNLQKTTSVLSQYKSECAILFTTTLVLELLDLMAYLQIDQPLLIHETNKQPQIISKNHLIKKDQEIEKTISRNITNLLSQKGAHFFYVWRLLKHTQTQRSCSLLSLNHLWQLYDEKATEHSCLEVYTSRQSRLNRLIDCLNLFSSLPEVFKLWKNKLLKFLVSALDHQQDLSRLIVSGFSHIFSQLFPESSAGTITFHYMAIPNHKNAYFIKFKKFMDSPLKHKLLVFNEILDILVVVLEQENLEQKLESQKFLSGSISPIFSIMHKHKISPNDLRRLEKILSRYVELSPPNNILFDFINQLSKNPACAVFWGDWLIPLTQNLLKTTEIPRFAKGLFFLRLFYTEQTKIRGFKAAIIEELYGIAIESLCKQIQKHPLEDLKDNLHKLKETFLSQQENLHFMQEHLKLLRAASKKFLVMLLNIAPTVLDGSEMFDLLTFTGFYLLDMQRLKNFDSEPIFYKKIVNQLVRLFMSKLDTYKKYEAWDLKARLNCMFQLITQGIELEETPDPFLVNLAVHWIKHLQMMDDVEIIKISIVQAIAIKKLVINKTSEGSLMEFPELAQL